MTETDYSKAFSDTAFWEKVKNYAKMAGSSVLEPALTLYFALIDKDTSSVAKATIIAALGYFISPIDVIPDVTPLVGFSDDLGILVAALSAISSQIKEEFKEKARDKMREWFD